MIDLAASITSSTVSTLLLYPIQRLKIQMQLDKQKSSITHSFSQILQKKGPSGFYQGMTPLIIGNALAYGIYFVSYQQLKKWLLKDPKNMLSIAKCSGLAGIIGSIATNPFYVLQTRQSKNNKKMIVLLKQMNEKQGILVLWKGLLASLILVSNPIIQFVFYQWLKKKFNKNSSAFIFIIGAISKILATFFTYPYTLLRTRQQIRTNTTSFTLNQAFWEIIEKQGVKGLFKGLTPKLLQTTLNSALILMIYQKIKAIFAK